MYILSVYTAYMHFLCISTEAVRSRASLAQAPNMCRDYTCNSTPTVELHVAAPAPSPGPAPAVYGRSTQNESPLPGSQARPGKVQGIEIFSLAA